MFPDQMYSARSNPWDQQGTSVHLAMNDPAIIQRSGLAWTAEKVPLYTNTMEPVPDHVAMTRSDTRQVLGVVGRDFQPYQNTEMFGFLSNVAGLADATIETAGCLHGGKDVWALARVPNLDVCIGDDVSRGCLLIANGHVGNRRLTIQPTSVRVVCSNTLAMATRQRRGQRKTVQGGWAIRHTAGMRQAVRDAEQAYTRALQVHHETSQMMDLLARSPLTTTRFADLMAAVFTADGPDERGRAQTIRAKREATIQSILASETCQVGSTRGTMFAGLNAITEFIDHERPTRSTDGDSQAARFASSIFGSGAQLKQRALETALSLC